MPHDRNGAVVRKGDQVLVFCTVKEVQAGDEYCNVQLETVEPMYPGEYKTGITLNAKQVVRVEPPVGEFYEPPTTIATPNE